MKEIFTGDLINVEKALHCIAYKKLLSDEFVEKFINKYKNRKFYTYRCYISDKNSLVLEKNEFKFYLKDDAFNDILTKRKNSVVKPNFQNKLQYSKDMKHYYNTLVSSVNWDKYVMGDENLIQNIYIRTQKIVVKSANEIYFINGRKIRRINLKNLQKYNYDWISYLLCDPISICTLGNLTSYNRLTKTIYSEIFMDKILDKLDLTGGNIYYKNENFYNNSFTNISEEQYNLYMTEISKFFPLLKYTNQPFKSVGNNINCFSQENEIPSYVKKKIATNYVQPILNANDIEFVVTYSDPKFNYNDNQQILCRYGICKYLGLKDINVIKKFLDLSISTGELQYNGGALKLYYTYLKKYYKGKVKNIELLLFNRLNELMDKRYFILYDSLRMFQNAILVRRRNKDKPFKNLDMNYLIKNGLNDIHDTLSQISRDDNNILNYKDFDVVNDYEKYESTINGYQFLMPHNSSELIRLADIMKNCVASYQSNILDKRSIIVYATNNDEIIDYIKNGNGDIKDLTIRLEKNDIPSPACIELREKHVAMYAFDGSPVVPPTTKEELQVNQCYGRHNNKLEKINSDLYTICNEYFNNLNAFKGDLWF